MFHTQYPKIARSDQTDTYHGVEVLDPFRHLEKDSPERAEWIASQNVLSNDFLNRSSRHSHIADAVNKVWKYESAPLPVYRGGRWFGTRNLIDRSLPVLGWSRRIDSKWHPLVDPSTWSDDRVIALRSIIPSPDGKIMAYSYAWGGTEKEAQWQFVEVDTQRPRPDSCDSPWGIIWRGDSKAFFYFRWIWVTVVEDGKSTGGWQPRVYCHVLGTPDSEDYIVAQQKSGSLEPRHSISQKYLLFREANARGERAHGKLVFVHNTAREANPTALFGGREAAHSIVAIEDDTVFVLTNMDAPSFRLVAVDMRGGEYCSYREVIPQSDRVLNRVIRTEDGDFLVEYLDGPISRLQAHAADGTKIRDIPLPTEGNVSSLLPAGKHAVYGFDSIAYPSTLFKVDLKTGKQRVFYRAKPPGFDPEQFETSVRYAKSKDGTAVPLVVVHKKGLVLDGQNPTLMYGYGGFNIPMKAEYNRQMAAWLQLGGVYVTVCTRGGGEFGEEWYRAGTKLRKQNVFDDFIAAAEWLIASGYTSPKKLAIYGASNGGLLTAVCMQQRPDLFAAVISRVGVHDLIRYHIISGYKSWEPDYGTSDNAEEFAALLKISPLNNVRNDVAMPPILILTGINDSTVNPCHSLKLLAALQEAQVGEGLVLGMVEMHSGHGSDSIDTQRLSAIAILTFIADAMKLDFKDAALRAAA